MLECTCMIILLRNLSIKQVWVVHSINIFVRTWGRCTQKSNKDLLKSFWANWSQQIPQEIFLLPKWTGWSIYCCLLRSDGIFFSQKPVLPDLVTSGKHEMMVGGSSLSSTPLLVLSLSLSLWEEERAQLFKAPAELWVSSLNVSEPEGVQACQLRTQAFY